jgi:hypothetical protein
MGKNGIEYPDPDHHRFILYLVSADCKDIIK